MIIFITTTFWESTPWPTIFIANRTPSIHPCHSTTLWFWWMMKSMVMPYTYARVIGIYHVNVIYTGAWRADYTPHRMEFLWVWRYEHDTSAAMGSWVSNKLDRLWFPPMSLDDAFGFLDPTDVMRAAHIILSFRAGKHHSSLSLLSVCTKDKEDWRSYYQNR